MFFYWLGSMLALATVCVLASPWLHRFINSQQRQADALHNIAGALLKRIEWEATCRRADKAEADTRAIHDAIEARRRPAVVDDSNLSTEAQTLLQALRNNQVRKAPPLGAMGCSVTEYKVTLPQQSAPPVEALYPEPKKPEPPPEAA